MPWKTKKKPAPKKGLQRNNKKATDLDGSILQSLSEDNVSNTFSNGQVPSTSDSSSNSSEGQTHPTYSSSSQSAPIDKSDAILAYLEK